jgi:hypothetical protein
MASHAECGNCTLTTMPLKGQYTKRLENIIADFDFVFFDVNSTENDSSYFWSLFDRIDARNKHPYKIKLFFANPNYKDELRAFNENIFIDSKPSTKMDIENVLKKSLGLLTTYEDKYGAI